MRQVQFVGGCHTYLIDSHSSSFLRLSDKNSEDLQAQWRIAFSLSEVLQSHVSQFKWKSCRRCAACPHSCWSRASIRMSRTNAETTIILLQIETWRCIFVMNIKIRLPRKSKYFSLVRMKRTSVQRSEASRLCVFYLWQVVAQVVALSRDNE